MKRICTEYSEECLTEHSCRKHLKPERRCRREKSAVGLPTLDLQERADPPNAHKPQHCRVQHHIPCRGRAFRRHRLRWTCRVPWSTKTWRQATLGQLRLSTEAGPFLVPSRDLQRYRTNRRFNQRTGGGNQGQQEKRADSACARGASHLQSDPRPAQ